MPLYWALCIFSAWFLSLEDGSKSPPLPLPRRVSRAHAVVQKRTPRRRKCCECWARHRCAATFQNPTLTFLLMSPWTCKAGYILRRCLAQVHTRLGASAELNKEQSSACSMLSPLDHSDICSVPGSAALVEKIMCLLLPGGMEGCYTASSSPSAA